ncbi:MAG: hypothetical protein C0606_13775 [Hyphomicrobiales bacterium]|nr:MAG: hypothetical protein C0606_13775 [Hyphomicrobiales bacterium]
MSETGNGALPPRRERRFGIGSLFLVLVAIGIAGSVLAFVMTGFSLDQREMALAERFAAIPTGEPASFEKVVPGAWTDICVLNTQIQDPGKTRNPDLMEGMLIPPYRNHMVYLESGYWILVALDADHKILGEYRVAPDAIANRVADNGNNFCASRDAARFTLQACDDGRCERRIVFEPRH